MGGAGAGGGGDAGTGAGETATGGAGAGGGGGAKASAVVDGDGLGVGVGVACSVDAGASDVVVGAGACVVVEALGAGAFVAVVKTGTASGDWLVGWLAGAVAPPTVRATTARPHATAPAVRLGRCAQVTRPRRRATRPTTNAYRPARIRAPLNPEAAPPTKATRARPPQPNIAAVRFTADLVGAPPAVSVGQDPGTIAADSIADPGVSDRSDAGREEGNGADGPTFQNSHPAGAGGHTGSGSHPSSGCHPGGGWGHPGGVWKRISSSGTVRPPPLRLRMTVSHTGRPRRLFGSVPIPSFRDPESVADQNGAGAVRRAGPEHERRRSAVDVSSLSSDG